MSFNTLGQPYTNYVRPSRTIDSVFLHCDASSNPNLTVYDIHQMHLDRGWSGCGYHIYIDDAGKAWHGRDLVTVGAHASGYNEGSIGISCNGLEPEDFSEAQFAELRRICEGIDNAHDGALRFRGHNEVAAKACPVYDYAKVLGLDANGKMVGGSGQPPATARIQMVDVTATFAQLGISDHHPHVTWVQNLLASVGYDGGQGAPMFGAELQSAVMAFQRAEGLAADGIVGRATWERLLDVGDD